MRIENHEIPATPYVMTGRELFTGLILFFLMGLGSGILIGLIIWEANRL